MSTLQTAEFQLQQGEDGATNKHYNQDVQLFRLFLDSTLKYSSGLYMSDSDSLDTAQQQKLDFIAEQLGASSGKRFLDIGCGWGSLVLHLAKNYDCEVVGLTPAPRQAEFIRARAAEFGVGDLVQIQVTHFQETSFSARSFDGMSMVGSIVHMFNKPAVLAECYRLCKRKGRVYLSESCYRNQAKHDDFESRPGSRYVSRDIFGWGDMVPLSTYVRGFEDAGFSLVGLRDLTADYHTTIEAWRANTLARSEEFEAIEKGSTERYVRYFETANAGWGYTTKHYALTASRSR
ncbi:MAG: class I SAM-dependent methyltransferase [Proteobacteria bacterium]|nr:class I SAM-dependent methyltransferase [Pseudomonadota bacterium]